MKKKGAECIGTEVRDGQTFRVMRLDPAGPREMVRSMHDSSHPSGTDIIREIADVTTGRIRKTSNTKGIQIGSRDILPPKEVKS